MVTKCMLCDAIYVYGYLNSRTDTQEVSHGVCAKCAPLFERWFLGYLKLTKDELKELASRERAESALEDEARHSIDGLTY